VRAHVSAARERIATGSLLVTGAGVLVFGVVVLFLPGADAGYLRSVGVAAIGMGGFGLALTWWPLRRGERWAWWALGYYPLFWLAHLAWDLPPGKDHVHQVAFIALSVVGLALSYRRDGQGTRLAGK
jgi:hypothetical protein